MARVLIVPCGCRGRALAQELSAAGHAVRGTTRTAATAAAIRDAGAEPYVGDPDRIGTLMEAIAGVTIVCWLAGTATGDADKVQALHGGRLRMLFERLVDTPVRGVLYESAGPLGDGVYARGREIAEHARATWAMPVEILAVDPAAHGEWLRAARAAVDRLLAAR